MLLMSSRRCLVAQCKWQRGELAAAMPIQVPDPVAAATAASGGGSAPKAISMPVLLPAIMSWIW